MTEQASNNYPLLNSEQAATLLGIKPQTLDVWRCTKRVSIPFVKVGRAVRYRREDVLRFIERNTVAAAG